MLLDQFEGYLIIYQLNDLFRQQQKSNDHVYLSRVKSPPSVYSLLTPHTLNIFHVINLVNALTTALWKLQGLPPFFKRSDGLTNDFQVTDCTLRNICLVVIKNLTVLGTL